MEIKLGGFYDQIAVGLTTRKNYPEKEFAGYIDQSVAFHGDDGRYFVNGKVSGLGCKFGSHDVVGCGITNQGKVFFTLNGLYLHILDTNYVGDVYPIVSLRGRYSSILVNFEGSFVFNIEEMTDKIANDDYPKFLPLYMIEYLLLNNELIEELFKLSVAEKSGWLSDMTGFLNERKTRIVEKQNKEYEKIYSILNQLSTRGKSNSIQFVFLL